MTEARVPHVAWRLVMVAVLACCVGYWLGASSSGSAVAPQVPSFAGELRQVTEELRGLGGRLTQVEALLRNGAAGTPSRQLAPDAQSDALEEQLGLSELRAAVDLLLQRASEFRQRPAMGDPESLRIARLQNPQPKLAAAEALGRALQQASSRAESWAVARQWWMMTMDAVIVKLGVPTNIIADGRLAGKQLWEYMRPDGETVGVLALVRSAFTGAASRRTQASSDRQHTERK